MRVLRVLSELRELANKNYTCTKCTFSSPRAPEQVLYNTRPNLLSLSTGAAARQRGRKRLTAVYLKESKPVCIVCFCVCMLETLVKLSATCECVPLKRVLVVQ